VPTVFPVTCPVCGCLCDDIALVVENNLIKEVKNACAMGEARFLGYGTHRHTKPLIRKNGELVEASLDEAIKKSAKILAEAAYPILYGWSSTSCEAMRVGLALAEEVGGVIDNSSTVCHGPSILSVQDVGISSCTLGQLRHRADLFFYWGSNPWHAHPRHLERYTLFQEGRFRKSAWMGYISKLRALLTKKRLMRATKLVLGRKNKDYELLQALRMLIRDEELDVDEVAGIPVEILEEVADVMINAELGVIFFGVGLTMSEGKLRNIDAALSLVRDLNRRTKFVIMPMRGHFNVTGANVVSTWQTGFPYAVDFSHGYPRYNPGETSVVDILCKGETDAGLVIASDPVAHFPHKAAQSLVENPLIVIDPEVTPTSLMADVVFPSAFVGIETPGTAYRMDHVPLPLKKVVEPPNTCLPDTEILRRLLHEIRELRRSPS